MPTVTVSPKFQVVIPREIREAMKLKAGAKAQVFRFRDRLELVPVRMIASMRGFLEGIADAVILATARAHGATIWTQDAHFEGLRGVRYRTAKPAP